MSWYNVAYNWTKQRLIHEAKLDGNGKWDELKKALSKRRSFSEVLEQKIIRFLQKMKLITKYIKSDLSLILADVD